MSITSIALVLVTAIAITSQIKNYQDNLIHDMEVLADLVSNTAANSIAFDDNISEQQKLSALEAADYILNAHIYVITEDNESQFFASYNKANQTIEPVNDRVEGLYTPIITNSIIEIARPISVRGKVVGYAYLRGTTERLSKRVTNTLAICFVILVISLIICLSITLLVQRKVTLPLNQLASQIHTAAQHKDYSIRAKQTQLKELDVLSNAFNVLLSRIQEHIQRQQNVEIEHQKLHASLEEKVNTRTNALKEANQELIETLEKLHQFQRQIVENEKMASLGDMVAGIAHEVNTPIGLGVTASTMMLDRLKLLHRDFNDKTLKASAPQPLYCRG